MKKNFLAKLKKIKILILDVDGVLTNNSVYIGSDGNEYKQFDIQDGFGIHLLQQEAKVKVALLSGRYSKSTEFRAKELEIEMVYNGYTDKDKALEEIKLKTALDYSEMAYMGDDFADMPVLRKTGVAIAVKNARPEVKKVCDYVTKNFGGKGAVREVIDLILKIKKIKLEY
jgi:3-deoxy-D-manno-octulosonate 8-phosphate phosphatase (KDO 8-P phosphatase)